MTEFRNDAERWAAVVARDKNADGAFYYSVATTGVYCRPSCGARLAKRGNVTFFRSCDEAEKAGFRACKRCRPREVSADAARTAAIAQACRTLTEVEEFPGLDALASTAGMSKFHFSHVFKKVTGVTPRGYFEAQRTSRVRKELRQSRSVTEAIYDAGFQSNSRFYSNSDQMLGMTPKTFRKGGDGAKIRFAIGESSLGSVLVAATEKGICSIALGDDPELLLTRLQKDFPHAELVGADAEFERWVAEVIGLIENPQQTFNLPLDIQGTAFQARVWQALRQIPPGSTATYRQIAEQLGQPSAVRAVAQACASNHLAVAVPCHRVVRQDGEPSGYRWGLARKSELLKREAELLERELAYRWARRGIGKIAAAVMPPV